MANPTKAFGLSVVQKHGDSGLQATVNPYYMPSTDSSGPNFPGDPVKVSGTSNTVKIGASNYTGGAQGLPPGSLPTVTIAVAGATNVMIGPISHVGYKAGGGGVLYRPDDTEAVVYVHDDPNLLYEVMADGAVAVTDVRANANLVAGAGGDTVFSRSSWALESSSIAAAQVTYQVNIHNVSKDPVRNDLASSGTNAVLVVSINLHQHRSAPVVGF